MIRTIFAVVAILCISLVRAQVPGSGIEKMDELARAFTGQKWKEVIELSSKDIQKQLSKSRLEKVWEYAEKEFGQFEKVASVDTQHTQNLVIARYRILFERTSFDLVVTIDDREEIISFLLQPLTYQLPDRMLGKVFNTEHVVVRTDTFRMDGELMLPDSCNNCPVVVIVHGSGAINRNLDFGPNRIYQDIAVMLAEKGIASLRYDKRTYVYKNLMSQMRDSLTVDDITVDDALSAIDIVRNYPMTDSSSVFILGHSLGALMAPRIAERDSSVSGIIMAAGPTVPLHHLIDYQYHFLFSKDGVISRKEKQILRNSHKGIVELDEGHYFNNNLKNLGPWGGSFWKDMLSYDPVQTIDKGHFPVLALYCERDYQVPPALNVAGWDRLLDSTGKVELKVYPGLNHLFLYGEGEPNIGEYLQPGHFSEATISDIEQWIWKHVQER